MFSKRSRYKKIAQSGGSDVVEFDAEGRPLEVKTIRPLAEVKGSFLHTVEESDRLDHLGYKYYKQPVKWWRICDANPDHLSPLALLGKEPLQTVQFTINHNTEGEPPFHTLLKSLSEQTGVRDAALNRSAQPGQEEVEYNGEPVNITTETITTRLTLVFNSTILSTDQLAACIVAAGFQVQDSQSIGRVGKQIVIPPDTTA